MAKERYYSRMDHIKVRVLRVRKEKEVFPIISCGKKIKKFKRGIDRGLERGEIDGESDDPDTFSRIACFIF